VTTAVDAATTAREDSPTRPLTRDGRDNRQISQLPYLPGLDGIRAVAVVAVMVYHANSDWLPGGYLGVEVFFVISGYLITLLLIAEHERSGEIDLKNFWIRRFRRLLPALFVMMLLLSIWVALFERDALGKLRGDVISGVFYGSNWYQIFIGAGYSAGNDFAPLRHLWSLAVEEQFYVIWPLVMLAFVRVGSRRIAGIARWLFLGAIIVTVVVALLSYTAPQQNPELTPDAYWFIGDRPISKPDALYLSTLSRAGGLLLGSAFAMVWRPAAVMRGPLRSKGRLFDLAAVLGFLALGVMAWFVSFQPDQGVHPFLFNGGLFLTGVATLGVIAAVTHQGAATGKFLSMPVLLWIGTRSYGLYLYHWPIFQIVRNIASNKLAFHEFVLCMLATGIITELSYRFVETPIRQGKLGELWKRRGRQPNRVGPSAGQRRGLLIGAMLGVALSIFAVGSMATAELKQNNVQQTLEDAEEFVCDALRDIGCDGVDDFDEDGNPITAQGEAATSATDSGGGAIFNPNEDQSGEVPVEGGLRADTDSLEDPNAADVEGAVPGSTAVPVVEPVPAAIAKLAVGDSVMRGAAAELAKDGFTVDAIESRAWVNGLSFVEGLGQQNRLPETLVIHLGTNGAIGEANMDRMMTAVAEVPTVVLLTNDVDRPYTADNNALIYDAASQNANVTVLEWQALTASCTDDCFESDGLHLKPAGQRYYAALVDGLLEQL
jgi:peptidoglycan/LPS O-acetylase OafA/YrhL